MADTLIRGEVVPQRHPGIEFPVTIRPAAAGDEAAWRELWAAYLRFYQVALPPAVTDATWRRISTPGGPMGALLAVDASGDVLGFLNYVAHQVSFCELDACLVDDIYVRPDARRLGIGRELLASLIARADAEGWSKVYWVALESNSVARRMFDRHFAKCDGHVRYTVPCRAAARTIRTPSPHSEFSAAGLGNHQ